MYNKESLIKLDNISATRGNKTLVSNLSISIKSGEILTLTGPNGSGKTTLLRLLASFIEPAFGSLYWNHNNIKDDIFSYRNKIVYISHLDPIKNVLSVEENLKFWSRIENNKYEPKILEFLGFEKIPEMPANFLSAGQRRRLNLARLVLSRRPIWLLDEPITSLDNESISKITSILKSHKEAGGITIVATHSEIIESTNILHLKNNSFDYE
tara:strand:- start:1284 stop:1916 length:633 start_codon:yes stop_codon:yes gene_type:complete